MNPTHAFRASFGRSVAQRLDRLGSTLTELRERLRAAVAHAVSVAAADAVRAVTNALLGNTAIPSPTRRPSWSSAPRAALWADPEEMQHEDQLVDYGYEDQDNEDLFDDEPPSNLTKQPRVRNALAVGFEGAAWWLRRGASSCYTLATVGVGLLCAATAYLVGDNLAGSILSLATLASSMRSATGLLACIGSL